MKTHDQTYAQFRILKANSKTAPLGPTDFELWVLPLSALDQPSKKLALSGHWSANGDDSSAALEQLERKIAELREASTEKPQKKSAQSVSVNFSSGATAKFLFIPAKISTYELHCELKKAFEDVMTSNSDSKNPGLLRFHLSKLEVPTARKVLHAISILSEVAHWKPTVFGKRAVDKKKVAAPRVIEILSSLPPAETQALTSKGQLLGQANNLVRTLADLPANELNPGNYRKKVEAHAKTHGLEFEFWNIAALTKKKAGAFLAVARADLKSDAGIARIHYKPKGKAAGKKTKHLALIGKGICFDTGGYNVKTGNYMLGMHGDMTGSAIALALCEYFRAIEAPFEVSAYLALAENLISPTAYKPNEIAVACDGTAIEVIDTDAEGRMVLADTLALARQAKPDLAIDFATLTGAAIRSLDTRRGAVFSNREELARAAVVAGDVSGERTWNFPIGEDYREQLKSKIADIMQCGPNSNADHIYAATFLSHFIGEETPWVHLDLVPAENKGGLGLVSTDTTGYGVLWATEFVAKALNAAQSGK